MKLLFILAIVAGVIFTASKYELHAKNLHYYFESDTASGKYDIQFNNGKQFTAAVEEDTAQTVKVNLDGAIMTFPKSEIKAMAPVKGGNFLTQLQKNYERHSSLHPIVSERKDNAIMKSWNDFLEEPHKLAEQMKKKNPWISQTETMNRQMAANAQSRLNAYRERQAYEQKAAEAY